MAVFEADHRAFEVKGQLDHSDHMDINLGAQE